MMTQSAGRRSRPSGARPRILRMRTLWFALAGLAVVVMLRRGTQTITEGYQTASAVLRLEEELAELQQEHDELQWRLQFLRTPEGKRLEAARQLVLVRQGEHLLAPPHDDEAREAMSGLGGDPSRARQPAEIVKRWARSPGTRPRAAEEP